MSKIKDIIHWMKFHLVLFFSKVRHICAKILEFIDKYLSGKDPD